jgi:hypothetical protein
MVNYRSIKMYLRSALIQTTHVNDHFDGRLQLEDGSLYVGWVDSKTGEPVDDKDIRSHYEIEIMSHAGVRLIGELRLNLHPSLYCL